MATAAVAATPLTPVAPVHIPVAVPVTTVAPEPSPVRPTRTPAPASAASLSWSPPAANEVSAVMTASPSTSAHVLALAATTVLHIAFVLASAAVNPAPPSPSTVTPTLQLNGLDFVPRSTREVTSLYGRWTYLPGMPTLIQGSQQFDVVDPNSAEPVGSFNALVSRGTGLNYTGLLVTSTEGANVGVAAGQIPPAGSLITSFKLGSVGFRYSALAGVDRNVVSFAITTPFGDIRLPMWFDAAKGIADRTVDNRPIDLGNGYSIAPADPTGETFTSISGLLPLFSTVQGRQVFNVYDSTGSRVGSFDGVFTTTSDVIGTYTQAIMVTGNDGTNVGTGAGQVPPVGSVYNVIYWHSDEHSYLYASLPSPSGDDISVTEINQGTVSRSAFTLIDASKPASVTPLPAPGGYRLVPVTALQPTGVNGLPPRDVQIQGYQQFDVFDPDGIRIGTVDADVSTQWDSFGILSEAVLVTGISADSTAEVPPVGSVFNVVSSGDRGFGAAHSVVPLDAGDLTSFTLTTPWGNIPLPSTLRPATGRTPVSFFNPFTV